MTEALTARVDSKGRLLLPKEVRKRLGLKSGDTLFLRLEGATLRCAKPENPFDGLARHAIEEHKAGRTRDLRDFAREHEFKLDE